MRRRDITFDLLAGSRFSSNPGYCGKWRGIWRGANRHRRRSVHKAVDFVAEFVRIRVKQLNRGMPVSQYFISFPGSAWERAAGEALARDFRGPQSCPEA